MDAKFIGYNESQNQKIINIYYKQLFYKKQ